METNLPQGLAVFALPVPHQRRLRTSNALERVNQELKRRTRVASLFPNEASLLRLTSALLNEIDDEWQTAKIYLNMDNHPQPSVRRAPKLTVTRRGDSLCHNRCYPMAALFV